MLTDTQKAQIRLLLNYPDGYRYRNTRLESVMNNLSPEAETLIATNLANLATVETELAAAYAAGVQGIKRVDEITFQDNLKSGLPPGVLTARDAMKFYGARISVILGVPFNGQPYSEQGYIGDDFSPGGWPSGGGINLG